MGPLILSTTKHETFPQPQGAFVIYISLQVGVIASSKVCNT